MNNREEFSRNILPHIKNFPCYNLSVTDRRNIEESVRKSVNAKSIYKALDIPDVRLFKDLFTQMELIQLFIKKSDLFKNYIISRENGDFSLLIDDKKYHIVSFFFNEIPIIHNEFDNVAIFLFSEDLRKVFFCGLFDSEKLKTRVVAENKRKYIINFE
jgi:hypothetical protein